jgi:hypothetical protein
LAKETTPYAKVDEKSDRLPRRSRVFGAEAKYKEVDMLKIAGIGVLAALATAPNLVFAEENAVSLCVDVSIPRDAIKARNGRWIELTPEQWQFLRGIYAMNPETPPGLPYGDRAALAEVDSSSSGVVFFIDGEKACTPMRAPPRLLALMQEVATGSISHQGTGL